MVCAHPPCSCVVDAGLGFCGPACRQGIQGSAEPCKCGHAECAATEGQG